MKSRIIEYAEDRIQEIQKLTPLLMMYGVQKSVSERQASAYQFIIEQIKEERAEQEIIRAIEERIRLDRRNNAVFYRDILTFIQKGSPLLPKSLLDLPQFIQEEKQKRLEQRKEQVDQRSRQRDENKRKKQDEKKLAERERIVQTLGLDRELLAGFNR